MAHFSFVRMNLRRMKTLHLPQSKQCKITKQNTFGGHLDIGGPGSMNRLNRLLLRHCSLHCILRRVVCIQSGLFTSHLIDSMSRESPRVIDSDLVTRVIEFCYESGDSVTQFIEFHHESSSSDSRVIDVYV